MGTTKRSFVLLRQGAAHAQKITHTLSSAPKKYSPRLRNFGVSNFPSLTNQYGVEKDTMIRTKDTPNRPSAMREFLLPSVPILCIYICLKCAFPTFVRSPGRQSTLLRVNCALLALSTTRFVKYVYNETCFMSNVICMLSYGVLMSTTRPHMRVGFSDMSWGLFVSVCLIDRAAKQGGIKVTKRYLRS